MRKLLRSWDMSFLKFRTSLTNTGQDLHLLFVDGRKPFIRSSALIVNLMAYWAHVELAAWDPNFRPTVMLYAYSD